MTPDQDPADRGGCVGLCCAYLGAPSNLEALARRSREAAVVYEMLVPLSPAAAAERAERFGGVLTPIAPGRSYYSCSNWDEDTRLCRVYESRPRMCRDFPVGSCNRAGCSFGSAVPERPIVDVASPE